ncbi:MAG: hypothetical protein US35_C0012G0019 [Parcubacteria group bacterium GW2011_GWA2_37_10]|nr:MAG: hypothetical protein US35_C0012G0019 [Parcubacteria group bacterium GW2011_GWA2_37_10]
MPVKGQKEFGEIINPRAEMTRDQALEKLKEAKQLLDLQMMTQEKYDSLKLVGAGEQTNSSLPREFKSKFYGLFHISCF